MVFVPQIIYIYHNIYHKIPQKYHKNTTKISQNILQIHCSTKQTYIRTAKLILFTQNRRRRLKGIHSRSDTNRTGAEGLSFYYPRLLYCLNQMLAVVLLSQDQVLSSKTVRARATCGAQCIGHAVRI